MRIILLVDMDYFYVACEELRRPEIKERPTIVGMDPKEGKGRGVVMTCNYLARRFGIRSGMPISTAYRLKPDALYLPLDYDYYDKVSAQVMQLLKSFADRFEQVSVDEAFLEISKRAKDYEGAKAYAENLKREVKERIGLPCSIGVSYNKLMAKMACESAKPNGVAVVKEEDAKGFLAGKPVDDLYGVGKKTAERLGAMGYKSVAELSKANLQELMERFGSFGIYLHNYANGIDESEVNENYDVKSIGRELTFENDTNDMNLIEGAIRRLSRDVIAEVEKQGVTFKVITVKMRYSDFTEHLKSRSVRYTNSLDELAGVASVLCSDNLDKEKKLRKIGVRVSTLAKQRGQKKII